MTSTNSIHLGKDDWCTSACVCGMCGMCGVWWDVWGVVGCVGCGGMCGVWWDVWCVVCSVWCVLCAVCCVLCAVCCVLCAVCCVLCAVRCVVCGVWCVCVNAAWTWRLNGIAIFRNIIFSAGGPRAPVTSRAPRSHDTAVGHLIHGASHSLSTVSIVTCVKRGCHKLKPVFPVGFRLVLSIAHGSHSCQAKV